MANDINIVTLVGRLTREAELKYTNSGLAVCKFSLAVNRRKRSGDQWTDEVSYFDIVLWGKQGEAIQQYLGKGKQIAVSGELRQNRWEQDGQKRSKVEVVASNVQLLGGGGSGGNSGGYSNSENSNDNGNGNQNTGGAGRGSFGGFQPATGSSPENFEDDIPF
ncbi:MAG: single-stranded DNA-binding protein [Spirochaetales bacterium]|nr:single-stranded DNA-binding protein [Spirochaetales bacterium]